MLYNLPKYYDISCSRDIAGETEFFIHCFQKYAGHGGKRILEPTCGSGMFLTTFPKYGYHITGYDINLHMVAYAKERIKEAGYIGKAEVLLGDMRITRFDAKFDTAINLVSSLSYCLSASDVLNHFRVIAHSLRKGGLYIVEIFCACKDVEDERGPDETWSSERDGIKIDMTWRSESYDIKNKIRHVGYKVKIEDAGRVFTFGDKHKLRLWFFEDFKRLTHEAGFRIEAIYNQEHKLVPAGDNITGELGALYYVLINT